MTGTESLPQQILNSTSKAIFTLLLRLDINLQMLLQRCVLATANATASPFAGMYAALHHAEDRHIHEFEQGSRPTPIVLHDCPACSSKPAQICYITATEFQSHSAVTWFAMIRWTQWIFIQLFNKGLAYQAEVPVNWCPALGTVLANEEIIDGKSERGDHPVERMPMKQVGTLSIYCVIAHCL